MSTFRRSLSLAPVFLTLAALLLAGCTTRTEVSEPAAELPDTPYQATLTGTSICLPHRDTTGPQTKECALGLKADDGNNYALDLSRITLEAGFDMHNGERITVMGVVVPEQLLSTDQWDKYDMAGIISVSSVKLASETSSSSSVPTTLRERRTITGTTECLPHRDTTGPQTMECAFGLKADDGKHYALDLMLLATSELMNQPTNERVTLEGLYTPIEELSTDHWQRYNVEGILTVTSVSRP